jgi:hypothetical protein
MKRETEMKNLNGKESGAEDFRSAADAAFKRLAELRAAREAEEKRKEPRPEPAPFSPETLRPAPGADFSLSSYRFSADGETVRVRERDGDVILAEVRGEEVLLSAADVRPLSGLPLPAAFRALRAVSGAAEREALRLRNSSSAAVYFWTDAPFYALRGRKTGTRIAVLRGRLVALFSKKRGSVTYYAPVSEEEAEALLRGSKSLYYVKNSNRYLVK